MSKDSLKVGEFIEKWSFLISKNGKVTLQLQDDDNLVLYDRVDGSPDKEVWSSNTGFGSSVSRGIMQDDGNFVLLDQNKTVKWSTGSNGKGDKSSFLYVADEGNAFIYSGEKEIWRARKDSIRQPPWNAGPPKPSVAQPAEPTTAPAIAPIVEYIAAVSASTLVALRGGQSLALKQSVSSPNGKVSLTLQDDGNLCATYRNNTGDKLLWTSHTDGKGVVSARLRANGELILMKSDKSKVWSSDTGRTGSSNARDAILLVQDDGHVIINANGSRIWRTLTPKLPGTETDRLNADEYLEMGQRLTSQNGKFRLIFQGDHNLCLYTDGFVGPLWSRVSEGRDQHPSQVIMRADDDLWYGEAGQREWTSTTRRKKGNGDAYLKLEDNGTLTIRSDGLTIWSSHEQKSPVDPWEPVTTEVLRGSSKLKAGEHIPVKGSIVSKNGHFQAWLAEQGNFGVFRKVDKGELQYMWSSKTTNQWVSKVSLSWVGEVALYGANAKKHWVQGAPNTEGNAELIMQDDGNLVLSRDGSTHWSSDTPFPASVKKVDRLRLGEWLGIDQSLTSANGQYLLAFRSDANLCIARVADNAKVFTNAAKSITGAQLMCFDKDNNDLMVYNKDGKQRDGKMLWRAGNTTEPRWGGTTEFIMQDDGNAVLFVGGKAAWSSKDNLAPGSTFGPLVSPTTMTASNTLRPSQKLRFGQIMTCGAFILEPGANGQIFIKKARDTIWMSGTDVAVDRSAILSVTDLGQVKIRGPMRKEDDGDGTTELELWTSKKTLSAPSQTVYLALESDGCPAIYDGPKRMWSLDNWPR